MPYYIAPYIGSGTALDSFRPRGSDQPGWSAIDLRPDGGATLGGGGLNACLLFLPVANLDPQLMLVAQAPTDSIGALLKSALVTRLNLSTPPTSTQWDALVAELLVGPPLNGWKALQPTTQGTYDVWLGGLLKQLPVISGGVSISENWNCADSASLTCQLTWTKFNNADLEILTNACHISGSAGTDNFARADSDLAGGDHKTEVTLTSYTTVNGFAYIGLLWRKDSTATLTFYWLVAQQNFGTNSYILRKIVTGTSTTLTEDTTLTPAVNDLIHGDASGSTITAKVNSTNISGSPVTDTAITGNLRCGVAGRSGDAGFDLRIDNWSAADLAAGSVVTPRLLALLGVGT